MANWTRKWKVTSFTDRSKEYTVSEGTSLINGKQTTVYGCGCAAWRFKKADPSTGLRPDCKHIEATVGKIKIENKLAIEAATRLLLDQWAVEEITALPKMQM